MTNTKTVHALALVCVTIIASIMPTLAEAQRRGGGGGGGGARSSIAASPRGNFSGGGMSARSSSPRGAQAATNPSRNVGSGNRTASSGDRMANSGNRVNTGDRVQGGNRIQGGNNIQGGNRVNTGDRGGNRVNTGDINRGDINIDVDNGWGNGNGWDWDDRPVAAGIAFGAAASIGARMFSLPPACSPYPYGGYSYYHCGGVYYEPRYEGDTVVYVVVDAPG